MYFDVKIQKGHSTLSIFAMGNYNYLEYIVNLLEKAMNIYSSLS